jgi:hypothetical protein
VQITHPILEPARGGETARGAAGFGLRHLLLALAVAVLPPPLAAAGPRSSVQTTSATNC